MVPLLSELGKIMKNEGKISIFFSLCNDATVNWFLGIIHNKLAFIHTHCNISGDFYSNVTEFVDYFIMECDMQNWLLSPRIALPTNLQVAVRVIV
jgi:hypothetical protein